MLMSYASLMVHVESGAASEARVRLAADLADRCGAGLIGLTAALVQPPPIDPGMAFLVDGGLIEADRERVEAELAAAEEQFRRIAGNGNRRIAWRAFVDFPADALAREARAADLLIVGRDRDAIRRGAYCSPEPGDVLMKAGRPVLIAPAGAHELAARHVVVGWKETREARRAVLDSLPILVQAEHVLVLEVCPEDEVNEAEARAEDVAAYLRAHGARADAQVRHCREETVADELVLAAEQEGSDLIVAGGYGHARLREWAFGGVTRGLLGHCPKCCLMAH